MRRESALVCIRTRVLNGCDQAQITALKTVLVNPEGRIVGEAVSNEEIASGETFEYEQHIKIDTPVLWSPETPMLYTAHSAISVDRRMEVDTTTSNFGIRTFRFDGQRGFVFNGIPVKLKGVNLHHDAGTLGAAVPERVWERRLQTLKEIGCNAIRCSHNPPAPELLDLCDQMGFFVIDEAFDKWHSGSYGRVFDEWWEQDLQSMLRRDRNHPSIILWSVGNEVEGQGSEQMLKTLEMLTDYMHREEPTRPVTCALQPFRDGKHRVDTVMEIAKRIDVLGCNYQEQWYELYRKADPNVVIIGTEIYPYFRGNIDSYKGFEPVNPWLDVEKHEYVVGAFCGRVSII